MISKLDTNKKNEPPMILITTSTVTQSQDSHSNCDILLKPARRPRFLNKFSTKISENLLILRAFSVWESTLWLIFWFSLFAKIWTICKNDNWLGYLLLPCASHTICTPNSGKFIFNCQFYYSGLPNSEQSKVKKNYFAYYFTFYFSTLS